MEERKQEQVNFSLTVLLEYAVRENECADKKHELWRRDQIFAYIEKHTGWTTHEVLRELKAVGIRPFDPTCTVWRKMTRIAGEAKASVNLAVC